MRWGWVFVLGFGVSAMSCLAPTEIILVLGTDVACNVVATNGVAIALGAPGDDDSGIATKTTLCAGDGGIGTAVLLPHSSIDQELGIRVTLGVDASADQCPPPNFPGCIVARRSLRFDPHTPLTLPIDLDQACIGVPCTPNSTCVSGACVDAGVECDGSSCGVSDDGGVIDAGNACQPITDVTVQTKTGTAAPRVALSNDGWAVAYQTAVSGIELADVHLSGGTVNVSQPITIVTANLATALGPLGGDGASYALSYTTSSTQAYITIVGLDGKPFAGNVYSLAGYQPAHFGMISVAAQTYGTAFIGPPQSNAFVGAYGYQPSSLTANNANITASGLVELNLAKGATDYYATTADSNSACALYKCSFQTTFTCSPLSTPAAACKGMRAAEGLGKLSVVVLSQAAQLTIDNTFPVNASVQGTEFQLVATSDRFHLVFVTSNGGLAVVSHDGVHAPGPPAQLLTQGTVVGVDAIADGPNSPGFTIVYAITDTTSVTSVHMMHLCL